MDNWHQQLPYLGLGLSTKLDVRAQQHPYRLKDAAPTSFDFVEYSAPLDVAETERTASMFEELLRRREEVPVLFHPVHLNLYGPELESAESLAALDAHATRVGSAWVGNDIAWWHSRGTAFPGYFYVPPPLTRKAVDDSALHAQWVKSQLKVPLVLENPTVIAPRGPLHVLDFMAELHARTGCPLLIDVGHLYAHQLARGLPLKAAVDGFCWDAVVELHIAGGVVTRHRDVSVYFDDHTQAVQEPLFELLAEVLPRCRHLRALTFEGDGHPPEIAHRTLQRLRQTIPSPAIRQAHLERDVQAAEATVRTAPAHIRSNEPEPPLPPDAGALASLGRDAWSLFDAVHAPPPDDSLGWAELEVRLSVLAEQIDRRFPLTRLFLAPDAESLSRFVASPAYRSAFETGGRSPVAAFSSWARSEARLKGGDALAAVLAFETFAEHSASHAGEAGAPVSFPVDLSELLFAARALRRHLGARAVLSGRFDHSALASLLEVARRAAPGPWQVTVREKRGRVEVTVP